MGVKHTIARMSRRSKLAVAGIALLLPSACSPPAGGTTPESAPLPGNAKAIRVVTVASGLEHPWGLAFLPGDEGILITERAGRLRIVRAGRLEFMPIAGYGQINTM